MNSIAIKTECAYLLVDVSCRKISLEPVFWVLVFVFVCQSERLLHLVVFVVACVNHDGGMVSQPADIGHTFGVDRTENGRKGRVVAATEHEILPN